VRFLISLVLYLPTLIQKKTSAQQSGAIVKITLDRVELVQSNLDLLKAILSARPFDLKSRISHYGRSRPGRKKAPHYNIYYCV
jgi:hypothetical protein